MTEIPVPTIERWADRRPPHDLRSTWSGQSRATTDSRAALTACSSAASRRPAQSPVACLRVGERGEPLDHYPSVAAVDVDLGAKRRRPPTRRGRRHNPSGQGQVIGLDNHQVPLPGLFVATGRLGAFNRYRSPRTDGVHLSGQHP